MIAYKIMALCKRLFTKSLLDGLHAESQIQSIINIIGHGDARAYIVVFKVEAFVPVYLRIAGNFVMQPAIAGNGVLFKGRIIYHQIAPVPIINKSILATTTN